MQYENMTPVQRVAYFEARYDAAEEAVRKLEQALLDYKKALPDLVQLEEYMSSGLWQRDFEEDEAGMFPKDCKRGVLSQDGLYDLLCGWQQVRKALESDGDGDF